MAVMWLRRSTRLALLCAFSSLFLAIGMPSDISLMPPPPTDGGGDGGADAPRSGQPVPGQWILTFHRDNLHALQTSSTEFSSVGPGAIRQTIISRIGAQTFQDFNGDISFAVIKMPQGQSPNLAAISSAISMGAVDVEPNRYISSFSGTSPGSSAAEIDECPDDDCTAYCSSNDCSVLQWALGKNPELDFDPAMNVVDAWQITEGDPNQVIAVVSDGVDTEMAAISSNLWVNQQEFSHQNNRIDDDQPQPGERFFNTFPAGLIDDIYGINFSGITDSYDLGRFPFWQVNPNGMNYSGTRVNGHLVSSPQRSYGLKGVVPNAKVMNIKISKGTLAEALMAYNYVLFRKNRGDKINVLVNDWVMKGFEWAGEYGNQYPVNIPCPTSLKDALRELEAANILVVASGGYARDQGSNPDELTVNIDTHNVFPVSCKRDGLTNILAVAPSDLDGRLKHSSFDDDADLWTNYGPQTIDIAAPGSYIATLESGESNDRPNVVLTYGWGAAISHAAGVAALIYSINTDLTPKQVIDSLVASGRYNRELANYVSSGKIINAFAALTRISNSSKITGRVTAGGSPVQGAEVKISPSGSGSDTRVTDSNGVYTFFNLAPGEYTLTATKQNFFFNGPFTVNMNDRDITVDFVMPPSIPIFLLRGTVTELDAHNVEHPLRGAIIDGGDLGKVESGSEGNFQFLVPQLKSYTIRPSKPGYIFQPASRTLDVRGDVVDVNFSSQSNQTINDSLNQWYSVSGRILDSNNQPLVNVRIDSGEERALTDKFGGYRLFVQGGQRTISAYLPGYAFTPASSQLELPRDADTSGNVWNKNFTGTAVGGREPLKVTIRGAFKNNPDHPDFNFPGKCTGNFHWSHDVFLYNSDGTQLVQKIRAASYTQYSPDPFINEEGCQNYAFYDVPPGDYLIATKSTDPGMPGTGYTNNFLPISTYQADRIVDFTLRRDGKTTIAGVVKSLSGQPLSGVTASEKDDWGAVRSQTTSPTGLFRFTDRANTHCIDLSIGATGFNIDPSPRRTCPTRDDIVYFKAYPLKITAQVVTTAGPLSGATVSVVGTSESCQTGQDGRCSFYVASGTYTLNIRMLGYGFDLPQATVTVNEAAPHGEVVQKFAATALPKYHISGTVLFSNGQPANRVSILAGYLGTLTTDRYGNYNADLFPGTYVLTPTSSVYTFLPATRTINITTNISGVNFVARDAQYVLNGRVMNGSMPVAGAIVHEGATGSSVVTDLQGYYIFSPMAPATCRLSVEKAGMNFAPVQLYLDHSQSRNFVAEEIGVGSIQGRVTQNGSGVSGVTIDGPGVPTVVTDSGGYYTIPNIRNGNYIVNASHASLQITPSPTTVSVLEGSNRLDFVATERFPTDHITDGQ